MLIACLNHGGVGASRGAFLRRWKFPYLIGLILFVLFENRGNCNQTFLFSPLDRVCSSPRGDANGNFIQLESSTWLAVSAFRTCWSAIGFEASQCLHSLALFLVPAHTEICPILSWTQCCDFCWIATLHMGVMCLVLCQSSVSQAPGNTYKLKSLECLPLQLLQPQPTYGTCFSCFLCLSFHNTGCFRNVPSGAGRNAKVVKCCEGENRFGF